MTDEVVSFECDYSTRGVDVQQVSLVISYDLCTDREL
jgi:superfamily II DNA/RNA helicase